MLSSAGYINAAYEGKWKGKGRGRGVEGRGEGVGWIDVVKIEGKSSKRG